MFEKLKDILIKSKEDNCDLSIAHAKVRNDERLAGITDHSALDEAYKLVNGYEETVTKMWREGNMEALEELCKAYAEKDTNKLTELVGAWS